MFRRISIAILLSTALLAPFSAVEAKRLAYASGPAQGDVSVAMHAGETRKITVEFANAGRYSWRGVGKNYTAIYASGPYGRLSAFRSSAWPTNKQAARLNESLVKPGAFGTVDVTLHAPIKPGAYVEQFQMSVTGVGWISGSVAKVRITVVPTDAPLPPPSVTAKSWIVVDAETGAELASQKADDERSIASITKLMTVHVAQTLGFDTHAMYTIERQDEVGGGRLRVTNGTRVNGTDLLASALIGSANNAANAIARSTGLSRNEFIARMDQGATDLGMTHSRFADPTGIKANNLSTARDVAKLSLAVFADPIISTMTSADTYTVTAVTKKTTYSHEIANTNKLVRDSDVTVVAGKTGFTYEAGYTLTTRLHADGKRDALVVVLGSNTVNLSFKEAKSLAKWVWSK